MVRARLANTPLAFFWQCLAEGQEIAAGAWMNTSKNIYKGFCFLFNILGNVLIHFSRR